MYKLSVPLYNHTLTKEMRPAVLRQLREAKVDRVFLIPIIEISDSGIPDYDEVCENIAFLQGEGYEVGIWVGHTIGHGSPLGDVAPEKESSIVPLRNFAGEDIPDTRCPFDKTFQANIATLMERLAKTGASILLIDDDFRISQHGNHFCCLCELHMARICELLGEEIARNELAARIFKGGPNRYRDAYLKAEGESLLELARVMREAVDRVDRKIGISLCHAHSQWDIDGADPLAITEIFRGDRAPMLRSHGAPYWVVDNPLNLFPRVLEASRMHAAFSYGRGVEIMTECDTYPRPRYRTPASYMELHDAVMRADRVADGALKYMYDYISTPLYEQGYLKAHCRDLPLLEGIAEMFTGGKQIGVRVCVSPHLLKDGDCDLVPARDTSPDPTAGALLAMNSIPTTYTENGICRALFGNNVREVGDDLSGGIMLDAAAALLLKERGEDVGLASCACREAICEVTPTYLHTDTDDALITRTHCRMLDAPLATDAEVLLRVTVDERKIPLLYRYENQKGERFLVWMHIGESASSDSGILQGYYVQKALTEGIEWLSGHTLAAKMMGHPQLYMLCRGDDASLSVGLFNCFADTLDEPTLTLGEMYSRAEFLGCEGVLEGKTLKLNSLAAYTFAAVKLTK